LEGTVDDRCPQRNQTWVWNDWKPILGENAWAQLSGTLHALYMLAGRDVSKINQHDPLFVLAVNFATFLPNMLTPAGLIPGFPNARGVYFSPRNMFYELNQDAGGSVSTENNASLLAALRMLLLIIQTTLSTSPYAALVNVLTPVIGNVEEYLHAAYDPRNGFFRQGGSFVHSTMKWEWEQGTDVPTFAVDCQTWGMSVLGPEKVDTWFGSGSAAKIWQQTKDFAGYGRQSNGFVKGLGYTKAHDIFSGEWTLGAVNMLRIFGNSSVFSPGVQQRYLAEADFMKDSVYSELRLDLTGSIPSVKYANKRYYIPFGWWANPFPALSSTAWAVVVDFSFNPFVLGGWYAGTGL